MTESEFLVRFDAHIAEVREEMRLSREQHADLRVFTRDLTRRSEIALGEMVKEMRDMRAESAETRHQQNEAMAEILDQSRAHTAALWNVLDRLN